MGRWCGLVAALFLSLAGLAGAQGTEALNMMGGNPLRWLSEINGALAGSGLGGALKDLAMGVAFSGFLIRIYAEVGKGDMTGVRGVVVQGIGVAVMLSLSPQITGAVVGSWNATYQAANSRFAGSISSKLDESGEAFGTMVGNVGDIATFAFVGGVGTVKALGSKALKQNIEKGAAKAVLANIGRSLTVTAFALNGFVVAYSAIIAISGFIVLIISVVAPLAISLTMWGQTSPLWACVGSALGALMIAAFMPVIAFAAMDKAFIEPAKMAQQYSVKLAAGQTQGAQGGTSAAGSIKGEVSSAIQDCVNQAEDSEVVQNCLSPDHSNILERAYSKVASAVNSGVQAAVKVFSDVVQTLTGTVIQVVFSMIYFVVALAFMYSAAQFVTSILGGAASFAGGALKGR